MTHYRIRGQAVNWFRSFLSQRVQYALVNVFDSESCLVTHGVPQGWLLGPLLFFTSINDLHKPDSQMLHFPDDTNLLYSSKSQLSNGWANN